MIVCKETWNAIVGVGAPPIVANLYGFVHDTSGNPLPEVSVDLNGYPATTNVDGEFSFEDIEPGDYTITCTKSGYEDTTKSKTLNAGDNEVDIEMLAEGEVPPPPPTEVPWLWIGIGLGAVAVIGTGIALAKKRK